MLLNKNDLFLKSDECIDKLASIFKEKLMVKKCEMMLYKENLICKTFIEPMFGENQTINKENFLKKSLNNSSVVLLFSMMEELVNNLIDKMEEKIPAPLSKYSLSNLAMMECSLVPQSIEILCEQISMKLRKEKPEVIEELIYNYGEAENDLIESIMNCINSGQVDKIFFEDVPFSVVVFTLKYLLDALPAPLFSFVHSKCLLKKNGGYNEHLLQLNLRKSLFWLPSSYYECINRISTTFNIMFNHFSFRLKKDLCQLFSICFFDWENENEMHQSIDYLVLLFSKAPKFFDNKNIERDFI
jgi:hypothetical protein